MSLATRCTRCGTTFRVVQDQLKVSEGWVRCGRCGEVFNALEGLFDLEREGTVSAPMPLRPIDGGAAERSAASAGAAPSLPAAPATPAAAAKPAALAPIVPMPPAPPPGRVDTEPARRAADTPWAGTGVAAAADDDAALDEAANVSEPDADADTGDARAADDDEDDVDTQAESRADEGGYQPLPFERIGAGDHDDDDADNPDTHAQLDTGFGGDIDRGRTAAFDDDDDDGADAAQVAADEHAAQVHELLAPKPSQGPLPGFLREAARAAQWERPRVRASLWVAAALLALVLAAQGFLRARDALAAQWPAAAPAMATLCEWLGCTIEAPRRIDALAVESSGLTRIEGSTLYRLHIVLRNRDASLPVMMPALDLTLTDLRSEVIARRVLGARDFNAAAQARLAPGAETQLAAVLDLGERRVAGYTVELFYP